MLKAMTGLIAIGAVGALALTACGASTDAATDSTSESGGSAEGEASFTIGLLLPETTTARYENKDKPYFEEALAAICPDCELLYANANSDQATQQQQAESMLTQGVDVLVVDPWDGVAAASIVATAASSEVPVVAYDRLIDSPELSYIVSNDYTKVGELQGQALVEKLEADGVDPSSGGIIMINGATTDNNAHNIKAGALSKIEPSGFEVLAEVDTWDPAEARVWVDSQVTRFGEEIVGVYSANDNNAASAIAAFAAGGLQMPPVTGLDASLQGIQNIIAGKQFMTTYNPFKLEAKAAAEAAYSLAQGEDPATNGEVDGHPAMLNTPIAVTVDNIESTIIQDEFWTIDEICANEFEAACAEAGLK
jgi:D-xylose transport system substrate-binding protein